MHAHAIFFLLSSELFTSCIETIRANASLQIHSVHWGVSGVAWHFDLVVLNDVLLDDRVPGTEGGRLLDSTAVKVRLRDESVVAWDMRGRLRRSNGQLVVLVALGLRITGQLVAGVVPMRTDRRLELGVEVASLRGVGLAVVTP